MPDLDDILFAIAEDVRAIITAPSVALGMVNPPSRSGV